MTTYKCTLHCLSLRMHNHDSQEIVLRSYGAAAPFATQTCDGAPTPSFRNAASCTGRTAHACERAGGAKWGAVPHLRTGTLRTRQAIGVQDENSETALRRNQRFTEAANPSVRHRGHASPWYAQHTLPRSP